MMNSGAKLHRLQLFAALAIFVVSVLYVWSDAWSDDPELHDIRRQLRVANQSNSLPVCDRPTNIDPLEQQQITDQYATKCQGLWHRGKIVLLLEGETKGGVGNQFIKFVNALQFTRDHDIILGIMADSWATRLLNDVFKAYQGEDGLAKLGQDLCIKVFHSPEETLGWKRLNLGDKPEEIATRLFNYKSSSSLEDYMNTGRYVLQSIHKNAAEQCKSIDSIFGTENRDVLDRRYHPRRQAIYTVIHLAPNRGDQGESLKLIAEQSGCDPKAALNMKPEFIKSILDKSVLDTQSGFRTSMLNHPIIVITDDDHSTTDQLERLQNDTALGRHIRTMRPVSRLVGADLTMAMMATVFIG